MKQVTRYESNDGVLFNTEEACKQHEHKQQVIKKIREGIDSACIAEDVFDFVVNNIELFCVPAGTVSSIHNGVIASTYSVWSHGSDAVVNEGTKLFVNAFEKPVPSAVPVMVPAPMTPVAPTPHDLVIALTEMSKKLGVKSVEKLYKEFGVNSFVEVESHQYYQMFNAVTEELKKSLPTTPLP